MHCRSCGADVNAKAEVCTSCGVRPLNDTKFCQECGASTHDEQEICTSCGCRLIRQSRSGYNFDMNSSSLVYPSNPPKSPGVAVILSCFFCGAGQIYLGQVTKGLVLLVSCFLLVYSAGPFPLAINIATMIDAYTIGKKLENGQPVGQWEFF
jgi:TM2 domain-containing membrane protein YozV/RNA polymerase subunit RPABC4/transcription elongation factor Spt4